MSTSSILVTLGTLFATALAGAGARTILRGRVTARRGATDAGIVTSPETPTGKGATTKVEARDPRIERVSEAYANGEIDERMLTTAARALGIDKEVARRRLEGAADAQGTATSRETHRAQTRAKNRKKNKQAKRSRQANRR